MNAKQYADAIVLDQGPRRNWMDEASYVDHQKWSYKQWAWHFLQRNPEYQAASIRTGPNSVEHAAKFGRTSLKPYNQQYLKAEDDNKCWLVERVSNMDGCYLARGRALTYELEC